MQVLEKLILGCANFGGVGSIPKLIGKGESLAEAHALLDTARDLGIYRFDTANTYGGGASEEILGAWLAKQAKTFLSRAEISTKVGNPFGTAPGQRPLCRAEIERHLEMSLRRLHLERITVYYLHVLDPSTPLEETLEILTRALDAGKISGIGLSNVTKDDVARVLKVAGDTLQKSFRLVQNEFHLLHTDDSRDLIPYLQTKNIGYAAYGPLAGGLLTGKYVPAAQPPQGSRLALRGDSYERFLIDENFEKIRKFIEQAKANDTTAVKAAVDFILKTQGIHSVLLGPRTPAQLGEMVSA